MELELARSKKLHTGSMAMTAGVNFITYLFRPKTSESFIEELLTHFCMAKI
jgi:hypothetical protein